MPPPKSSASRFEAAAQAGAFVFVLQRVVDLGELLEDARRGAGAMPMPVSRREDDRVAVGREGGGDPHFALLGELQRVGDEVAQDLRNLAFVGVEQGHVGRSSKSARRVAGQQRPQHAAQGAEQARLPRIRPGRDHDLARLHLGQIEQIVDQLGEILRRFADEPDLLALLVAELAVGAVQQQRDSARIELSGVRNSWLMLERKRVFISSARRRCSARSSSSA